jgi:hypothetical protein
MNDHIDYDSRLRNLGSQVSQFSSKMSDNVILSANILEKLKSSKISYFIFPISIFIILLVSKPVLIMNEVKIDSVLTKKVVNYKKLLMFVSVLTFIIGLSYFIYRHKIDVAIGGAMEKG